MKKTGFTLAEILVVMTIIGFLFTLMLPTLVQKQSTSKHIEALKTAHTTLQDAFTSTAQTNNNKPPQEWVSVRNSENKSEAIIKEVSKKLHVMSFCGNSANGCFGKDYKTLNGVPTSVITDDMGKYKKLLETREEFGFEKQTENDENNKSEILTFKKAYPKEASTYISLLDGGSVVLKTNSTYCKGQILSTDPLERPLCGVIYVDVNGPSIPNMLGVDTFGFYLSDNMILPMGFYGDDFSFDYNCLRETPKANKYNGLACTAWALKNKNMEYRKCQAGKRLGWASSTRCDIPPNQ